MAKFIGTLGLFRAKVVKMIIFGHFPDNLQIQIWGKYSGLIWKDKAPETQCSEFGPGLEIGNFMIFQTLLQFGLGDLRLISVLRIWPSQY